MRQFVTHSGIAVPVLRDDINADQIKPAELEQRIGDIKTTLSTHPAAFPDVLATSSETAAGIAELRAAMVRLLGERA